MKGIYGWTEERLREYPSLDKRIEERKLELQYPPNVDYNPDKVQTSGYQGNSTEDTVIKWETDLELIRLRRQKQTIKNFLEEQNPDYLKMIELRYFERERYTWVEIACKVGYHDKWCQDVRKKLLIKLAERLSWMK